MAWVKLHTDILDDIKKTRKLSANSYQIFTFLLLLSKELESNGEVNLPLEDIQWRLRVDMEILKKGIADLKKCGILSNKHSGIKFSNWSKRQYSESYDRVKKHREMKRYSNGERNASETDIKNRTDTETDKKEKVEKEKAAPVTEKSSRSKIDFDFTTGQFTNIDDFHLNLWRKAYPAVEIETEVAKAAAWLVANPKNQKSNYERYLSNWFSRTQDRAPRVSNGDQNPNVPKDYSWIEYSNINSYRRAKAEGKKNITLTPDLKRQYPEEV